MDIKSERKIIAAISCLLIITVCLCGCDFKKYRGNYPELYTVAISSVLWNAGYSMGADHAIQPEIEIIEKDEYGRVLFTYYEKANAESNLIVMQASADGYAYYYEDYNFLTKSADFHKAEFSKEEEDYLKSLNDWRKEVDFEKCVKKPIVNIKADIPCDGKIIEEKVIQYFDVSAKNFWINLKYFTEDGIGNFIVYGYLRIYDEVESLTNFVVLVKVGCEDFEFFVPTDLCNYQDDFKIFKEQNGWIS